MGAVKQAFLASLEKEYGSQPEPNLLRGRPTPMPSKSVPPLAHSLAVPPAVAQQRGHFGLLGATAAAEEVLVALVEHDGPVVLGLEGVLTRHHGERETAAGGQE